MKSDGISIPIRNLVQKPSQCVSAFILRLDTGIISETILQDGAIGLPDVEFVDDGGIRFVHVGHNSFHAVLLCPIFNLSSVISHFNQSLPI